MKTDQNFVNNFKHNRVLIFPEQRSEKMNIITEFHINEDFTDRSRKQLNKKMRTIKKKNTTQILQLDLTSFVKKLNEENLEANSKILKGVESSESLDRMKYEKRFSVRSKS